MERTARHPQAGEESWIGSRRIQAAPSGGRGSSVSGSRKPLPPFTPQACSREARAGSHHPELRARPGKQSGNEGKTGEGATGNHRSGYGLVCNGIPPNAEEVTPQPECSIASGI